MGVIFVEENQYVLEMKNIVKTFPGVKALKGVDFSVGRGEVHALVGENGAGKSTLMKCLIGIHAPTSGEIYYKGELQTGKNTAEMLKTGISMIHQELNPVATRSIMENIWLGREPLNIFGLVDHKKMYEKTKEVLKVINLQEDPKTEMSKLTVAKMQMIEIAKAVSYNADLIIMDEPTSAITDREVNQLFTVIRKLRSEGRSIIYISHKLDEIFEITDKVTVMRDGEFIGTVDTKDLKIETMINMMVGRNVDDMFPKIDCPIGEVVLEVNHLASGKFFKDVSFTARKGEILGVAGLVGAGRTEIIETIFGIRRKDAGEILINGKKVNIRSSQEAIANGMALLTEDRRETGIFPMLSVSFNTMIANIKTYVGKTHLLNKRAIISDCKQYAKAIQIKTPSLSQRVENLSGGNQQKVLIARWLLTSPQILFLDEPTRGIDVGAKAEIHKIITKLAGEGKTIIMISSEMPEVMGMSDRIMVVHDGKITGILENDKKLTQEILMAYVANAV
ncbi:MAG: sugar ABC transporter ATP-binding protein [Eubacteriales bacterium]